ncbi:hypothetical protein [Nocardia blacklockiae]|uniref:hypothetical protein n=1 Tax=Nocardia blacklockiae TaxID=480036 RepID=UPI0018938DA0|nr:hypothetical protein [Nocardia blacklockiae]MBF6176144.1 hypothetical protein [Nocardia blacklockiae]
MNLRAISVLGAAAAITVGVGVSFGAGPSAARPFGPTTCSAQPEASRIVTTCVNEDDAPAAVGMQALCTNLRIFWLGYTAEADTTQQFVEDCGPDAHPILWNAQGLPAWQAQQEQRERQQEQLDRMRERQLQDQACPPGTMNMGRIC